MQTLALDAGAPVAVIAEEWHDAFCLVTHGRVQLELRDGEPGPVLERDAGFWLRSTGVRALHNPDRRTARVRIITPPGAGPLPNDERNDMNSTKETAVATGPGADRTSHPHRLRRLAGTGFIATLAATAATTLAAALARAAGADFEVTDGGETIPLSGIAVVTGFFSAVGIVIAAALLRLSARPAERFVWTAMSLTAISLAPPLLSGADTATTTALLGLHLIPAAVMIPTLARSLGTRTG